MQMPWSKRRREFKLWTFLKLAAPCPCPHMDRSKCMQIDARSIVLSHPGMLMGLVSFDWCLGGLTEGSGVGWLGWLRRESLGPSVLRNETMVCPRYLF